MTERVYLHVGAMKTGTSYLQQVLKANRPSLRRAGVLVPARRSAAVHDILDHDKSAKDLASVRGEWDRLVSATRAYDGGAMVLSHEFLSLQGPKYFSRVAATLEEFEVHVVLTLRDAAGTLPAQWQTFARNKGTLTWPEYAAAAVAASGQQRGGGHTFVVAQRAGRILRQWGAVVGHDRLHVVTVPRSSADPDLLWERFAGVVGVDPDVAPLRDVRSNSSAGYPTAHLLCLLHQAAARAELPRRRIQRLTVWVAEQAAASGAGRSRPPLDEATLRFTSRWNRQARRAVQRSGASLSGSLEDLPAAPQLERATPLVVPSDEEVLAAAAGAAGTIQRLMGEPEAGPGWGSVDDAVAGLVALLARAAESGAADRLNHRGTGLADEDDDETDDEDEGSDV